MYRDGGSQIYQLSNGVYIFIDHKIASRENGYTTLSWPDKKSVTFDKKGHIVRQQPATDCLIGNYSCADLAREINQVFKDRDAVPPAPGFTVEPDGSYIGAVCREDICTYGPYPSDLRLLHLPADQRRREEDLYLYDLPDGRKLRFNWQTGSPERGFLTVIKADGTHVTFDPQGRRVAQK